MNELARGEWIARAENIILAGPIGTGKTHLAIALGVEAARQRRRVLFARAADVVRSLIEARDSRELGRLQRRLLRISAHRERLFRRHVNGDYAVVNARFASM